MGLVRFELTIDGSLRHASVLQRVIIKHREPVPMFFPKISGRSIQQTHCSSSAAQERKDRWSPSPYRARPQPRFCVIRRLSFPDSIKSQCINLRVVLFAGGLQGAGRRIQGIRDRTAGRGAHMKGPLFGKPGDGKELCTRSEKKLHQITGLNQYPYIICNPTLFPWMRAVIQAGLRHSR